MIRFKLCPLLAVGFLVGVATLAGCRSATDLQTERDRLNMEAAAAYMEQGLEDSALAAFGLAIEENPKLTAAHMGMGDIYRHRGQYSLAARAYKTATELEPGSYHAHYALALTQQLWGKIEAAIQSYLRALLINPDSFEANQNLTSAYLQQGQPASAMPYAQAAVRINPDSQTAWANLGATYNLLGQQEQAVEAYRQASELGRLEAPILLGLADSHIKLGHYDRAINVLQTINRQSPSATTHERIGFCLFKQRKYDQALASFEQALQLDENDTSALNGKGVCLMTMFIHGGRENRLLRDQAMEAWRKSVKLNSAQPRIIDLISRYQRE